MVAKPCNECFAAQAPHGRPTHVQTVAQTLPEVKDNGSTRYTYYRCAVCDLKWMRVYDYEDNGTWWTAVNETPDEGQA
jgi:hypothetical protein